MLIDLRPAEARRPPAGQYRHQLGRDRGEARAEARRPVEGQIEIDSKARSGTYVRSVNVFNQDFSYSMLVGAPAVRDCSASGRN